MALPAWPGADVVYSRCLRILEEIQEKHMAGKKPGADWRRYNSTHNWPSAEMAGLIKAMNLGDEKFLKAAILRYQSSGYLPMYLG